MPDPIHSSSWTGPLEEHSSIQHGAFTYGPGEPVFTSDYQRLLRTRKTPPPLPPGAQQVIRLNLVILFWTPASLLLAWLFLRYAIRDTFLHDNLLWLVGWGVVAIGALFTPFGFQSSDGLFLRRAFVVVMLAATTAFSVAYVKLGLDAHALATVSVPQRTYELRMSCGRRCSEIVHQRADGTLLEGGSKYSPVPYGSTCTLVQRLDGDYGFSWVRVLERSQRSSAEIIWPIGREDCFGSKPISSLHG